MNPLSPSPLEATDEKTTEELKRLLSIMDRPFRLILSGGRYGLKTARKILPTVFLFIVINGIALIYAITKLSAGSAIASSLLYLGGVMIIGAVIVIYVLLKSYKAIRIDLYASIYEKLTPFFNTLSLQIAERAVDFYNQEKAAGNPDLEKFINVHQLLTVHFGKVPGVLKKVVSYFIKRIPIYPLLNEFRDAVAAGDNVHVGERIFLKIDTFVRENIADHKSTRWILWCTIINLLLQAFVISRMQ